MMRSKLLKSPLTSPRRACSLRHLLVAQIWTITSPLRAIRLTNSVSQFSGISTIPLTPTNRPTVSKFWRHLINLTTQTTHRDNITPSALQKRLFLPSTILTFCRWWQRRLRSWLTMRNQIRVILACSTLRWTQAISNKSMKQTESAYKSRDFSILLPWAVLSSLMLVKKSMKLS